MPGERILIVDDDLSTTHLAADALGKEGFSVKTASSRAEALALIEEEGFDLLVANGVSPGLDGLGLIRRAREVHPSIASIAMAQRGKGGATTDPPRTEMDDSVVVLKPFAPGDLESAVREALGRRELPDEDLRLKMLMPLFELSNALMSEVNLERLLALVVEIVSHETRADRVSLMLLDESGRELAIKAAVGLPSDVVRTAVEKVGHGIAGSVAKSGKPILLNGEVQRKDRVVSGRTSSALCVPLAVGGRVIGVLNSSKTGEESRFTQSDLQLLSILAGQAAIAIENARLFHSVEVQQARLEELLRELLKAQEEERERISAEIHDSVAQWMVSASYHAQSASALVLESKLDEACDELEQATRIIGQSIRELRRIVTDLYPPALTELGLQEALRQNIECFRKETGVQCRLRGGLTRTLSPVHQIVVYRVVQEALHNVRKHAHASEVDIDVRSQKGRFRVEIRDNGRGFEVGPVLEGGLSEGRMGLLTMKGRAEMLGGSLSVESSENAGTRVVLTLPLPQAGSAGPGQSGTRGGVL